MRSHSRDSNSPELCNLVVPLTGEGAGKAGRRVHPQPGGQQKTSPPVSHHEFSQSHRLSPRNGFTVSFVLSPVSGVFCHRCRTRYEAGRVDATVAAPGPHDFAVRSFAVVAPEESAALLRPSHSGPTYVTIARYVPFGRTGTGEYMPLIWVF